jgi:hypothetical protein
MFSFVKLKHSALDPIVSIPEDSRLHTSRRENLKSHPDNGTQQQLISTSVEEMKFKSIELYALFL